MNLKEYTTLVAEKAEIAMERGDTAESIRLLRLLQDVAGDKIREIEKAKETEKEKAAPQ